MRDQGIGDMDLDEAPDSTVLLLMTMTTVFWAGSFIATKIALRELPAMTIMFYRFIVATTLIVIIAFRRERTLPSRSDIPLLLGLGLTGIFIYNILQFNALLYTSAGNASTINALVPLTSSVLATFFIGEKLTKRGIGCIILALIGVIAVITNGDLSTLLTLGFNRGDLLMLGAMLCFSIYSVFSRKATKRYTPMVVTAYAFLFGFIPMIPLAFIDGSIARIGETSILVWMLILFMAVCSSVVGYLIQQVSLKKIGVTRTMLFMNLVPVFSLILSAIILGDDITPVKIGSAALIIAAVVINSLESKV
jgi:drug/metabolite transporter (DMT)-like permease